MTREEIKARRARIAWTVSQGHKSIPQIAGEFGVSKAMVNNACLEHGVPLGTFSVKQLAERNARILKAAAGGEPAREIANRLGIATSLVYAVCSKAKQRVRRPPRPPGKGAVNALRSVNIACDLLAGDGNQTNIADRHNVTRAWVSLIAIELKKRGLLK